MEMRRKHIGNGFKRVLSSMLAFLLCLGMSMGVLAGAGGTKAIPATAELTKVLKFSDELSAPTADFKFDFTPKSLDGGTTAADTAKMPALSTQTLQFSSADTGSTTGNVVSITKSTSDVLFGVGFSQGGVYVYEVEEQLNTYTTGAGEAMAYSTDVFDLYVVVAYDAASGTYFVEQTYTDLTGSGSTGKGGASTGDTDYNFTFTNTYSKSGGTTPGTPGNKALTIKKAVAGTGADAGRQFDFELTLDDSAAVASTGTYAGTITRAGGTTVPVSVSGDGTTVTSFKLAAGDELVFDSIPVGTVFHVEETGATGYTASYTGTDASGAISGTGTAGQNLATGNQIIGTVNNIVEYTNTYDSSLIPTGVLMNNLPFIVLIGAAVLALIIFAAANRRKAMR